MKSYSHCHQLLETLKNFSLFSIFYREYFHGVLYSTRPTKKWKWVNNKSLRFGLLKTLGYRFIGSFYIYLYFYCSCVYSRGDLEVDPITRTFSSLYGFTVRLVAASGAASRYWKIIEFILVDDVVDGSQNISLCLSLFLFWILHCFNIPG